MNLESKLHFQRFILLGSFLFTNYVYVLQVMVVFKYIEDKDVFQKFYSKMLAKRLVRIVFLLSFVHCI